MKTALITGITGQDGSYLAEWLLAQGYRVHGLVRHASQTNVSRIAHLLDRVTLHPGDLLDQNSLIRIIDQVAPDEVYNLAGMSLVPLSWDQPILTGEVTGLGVTRMLEAIRLVNRAGIRFYQASSSEIFGKAREVPQTEATPCYPRSPYGVAKLYGHWTTINYRESHGMFCCNGILFNHESPRRGLEFVVRKITCAAARIKLGLQDQLHLGNLSARRDWGYAADYVKAMWLMLQNDEPDDFVIATGVAHSVLDVVTIAFEYLDLDYRANVVVDDALLRPAEVHYLVGDACKAQRTLGWQPETSLPGLVRLMVDADLALAAQEARTHRSWPAGSARPSARKVRAVDASSVLPTAS